MKNSDCWYAIVNPNAGSGKTLAQWRKSEAQFYEKGIHYSFARPESASDAREKITNACRNGFRKFIAVGGDGTVHNTLNCIVNYVNSQDDLDLGEFYLAVLPIGSGNDWLRSRNVPNDHRKIIELIASGALSGQDVVQVDILDPDDPTGRNILNTRYMANIGGYSFDANVCDIVNFQKAHGVTGKMLYVNALRSIAARQKSTGARIVCDGETVFDDLVYSISFGNGRFSGGGLCQTPSARMDDGIIDLMVAPKFPLWKLIPSIRKLLTKRIESIRFLRFYKAREILLEAHGQGQLIEVDGEIVGRAPARLRVLPSRINAIDGRL